MKQFHASRTNNSVLARWYWTTDFTLLGLLAVLAGIGVVLVATASVPIAQQHGLEESFYLKRHIWALFVGVFALLFFSTLSQKGLRRVGLFLVIVSFAGLLLVIVGGTSFNEAKRWLVIGGFSFQPSELAKPAFVLLAAHLLTKRPDVTGFSQAGAVFLGFALLFLVQPDLGQAIILAVIFMTQILVAGLPFYFFSLISLTALAGLVGTALILPHVAARLLVFFDPASTSYQGRRSVDAFMNGGWVGTGPGQGVEKFSLPDTHADFIFAVLGEEFGAIGTLAVVLLFGGAIVHAVRRLLLSRSRFALTAGAGALAAFASQAFVNMGSAVGLLPTKGTTLPLISLGGSALLAASICLGIVLATTRRGLEVDE